MEILDIQMKHFGRFTDQTMRFHSGMNVIYGENETGKSTMHAFIRAMFYGLERVRGKASKKDEYTLRMPWENGSYFAGTLRFESGGKIFRLERDFSKNGKYVHLFCETDGEELQVEQGDLDVLLDGMSETAFSNTLFLGQQTGETDEGLAIAVRNYMVNARTSGLPDIDVKKAMETLQKERKRLESEKKKQMAEKVSNVQENRMKADYLAQELGELEREYGMQQKKLEEFLNIDEQEQIERAQINREPVYEDEGKGVFWKTGKILMALIAVAALAASLATQQWEIRLGAVGMILLSCLGVRFFGQGDQKFKERKKEWELQVKEQKMQAEYELQRQMLRRAGAEAPKRQKIKMQMEWLENTIQEKKVQQKNLEEQYQKLQENGKLTQKMEKDLAAIYLAIDTLEDVTGGMYQEYARKLNDRVAQILSFITGGRYGRIYLDDCMQVKIYSDQKLLNIEQVSRGTMEQVWFSLRMAAAELLNPKESMPVLLDDAFAMYDDTRLFRTLQWLLESGHQVILFTCQKREQQILQQIYEEQKRKG